MLLCCFGLAVFEELLHNRDELVLDSVISRGIDTFENVMPFPFNENLYNKNGWGFFPMRYPFFVEKEFKGIKFGDWKNRVTCHDDELLSYEFC